MVQAGQRSQLRQCCYMQGFESWCSEHVKSAKLFASEFSTVMASNSVFFIVPFFFFAGTYLKDSRGEEAEKTIEHAASGKEL